MKKKIFGFLGLSVLAVGALTGCHKGKTFDANVEITRISPVRKDENGRTLVTDVEFDYKECPGEQIENIRGGEEFSQCIAKHAVGKNVPIKIDYHWDPEGHYTWDVLQIADCKRVKDENDEASFATIRECEDSKENGVTVGFECQIAPKKELLKKCPWFAPH